jgi:hypothetical protein
VSQVSEAVTNMDQTTQENAAMVEEMAGATESLRQQSGELVRAVSIFRLQGESQAAAQPAQLAQLAPAKAPPRLPAKAPPKALTQKAHAPVRQKRLEPAAPSAPAKSAAPAPNPALAPKPAPAKSAAEDEWENF